MGSDPNASGLKSLNNGRTKTVVGRGVQELGSKNFGDCREYKTSSLIGQAMFVPRFFALAPETPLRSFDN